MRIRKMTKADLPAVAALERACFSQPWSERGFADAIAQSGNLFLVAEIADQSDFPIRVGKEPAVLEHFAGCGEWRGKPAGGAAASEHFADCGEWRGKPTGGAAVSEHFADYGDGGYGSEHFRSVVAYCGLYTAADEGEITNVAVAQDARGSGIGFSLVTEICRRAAKRGVERIFLEVRRSNTAARGLYVKAGFTDCGVRKGFYEFPAEDAMVMVWQPAKDETETPVVKDERGYL